MKKLPLTLFEMALADLKRSNLGERDAMLMDVDLGPRPDITRHISYGFPHHDVNGRSTGYQTRRLLVEVNDKHGKTIRYMTPNAQPPALYIPRLYDGMISWKHVVLDTSTDLLITEGCKKGQALVKAGYHAIALAGVWNFRSAKHGIEFLPDFDRFKLDGRKVFICYDSDAATNPNVRAAERALAKQLTLRGALPYIIRLNGEN
jgi:putative DNA primase/helicase